MIWTSTEQIASVLATMSDVRDQSLKAQGQRIAELRKARGWSQEDLAHKIGVGVGTVSRWERGLHAGYPEHSRDLAETLGVPVAELRIEPMPTFLDQLDRIELMLEELDERMRQLHVALLGREMEALPQPARATAPTPGSRRPRRPAASA